MKDVRWKQRFENFEKAYNVFCDALAEHKNNRSNKLYKMALIQSFEVIYELSWKLMKDYLEAAGLIIQEKTPRGTVKEAYAAKIIANGEIWIELINTRNILSHVYDEEEAEKALSKIIDFYSNEFVNLYIFFGGKV